MMYKRLFFTLVLVVTAFWLNAQCLGVQNCPSVQDTLNICVTSADQPALWSNTLFFNNVTGSNNLFEGEAELGTNAVYTPNCSTPIDVRFELFLDLDGNGSQESVVQSWALPPAGALLYNNFTDPQNSGTLVSYDNRTVPLNQKYQFATEVFSGSGALSASLKFTTDMGGSYSPPILPNGTHKIIWTFTSSNGESASCTQVFRVKDCYNPIAVCNTGLVLNLVSDNPPSVTLWASDINEGVNDNVSPPSEIQVLVREFGTNTPFTSNLTFGCSDLGVITVQLLATDQSGNSNSCWGEVYVEDNLGVCTSTNPEEFSFCLRRWCDGALVAGVDSLFVGGQWVTEPENCGTTYPAPGAGPYTASLVKGGDLLNGVTVLDAWRIIGHILGIAQFGTPFEILAADVNQSGSVTTLDVVQILRAIAGLPHFITRPSWTVLDSVSLTGTWTSPNTGGSHLNTPFIAVKTADLDCDGAPGIKQTGTDPRSIARLTVPNLSLSNGDVVEVPIRWEVPASWLCFQFGLLYDSTQLELLGFESVLNNTFGLINSNTTGTVNLAWLDLNPVYFQSSDTLITLRFKARTTLQLLDALQLYETSGTIQGTLPIGYNDQQEAMELVLAGISGVDGQTGQDFPFRRTFPNPSEKEEAVLLQFQMQQIGQGLIEVFDMQGKRCYELGLEVSGAIQTIQLPAEAFSYHSGLYTWKITTQSGILTGKISRY